MVSMDTGGGRRQACIALRWCVIFFLSLGCCVSSDVSAEVSRIESCAFLQLGTGTLAGRGFCGDEGLR